MNNNRIIKTSVLVLISFFITNVIIAQSEQKPPKIPDASQISKMVKSLSEEVSLSNKQQDEIYELHISHFDEMKEILEENKQSHEKDRKKMDKYRKDFENKIKKLLNDEQQELFVEFMKSNHKLNKQKPRK